MSMVIQRFQDLIAKGIGLPVGNTIDRVQRRCIRRVLDGNGADRGAVEHQAGIEFQMQCFLIPPGSQSFDSLRHMA